MPFKKGQGKIGGRKEGSINKAKKEIKEAFKELVEGNLDNITSWMERVALTDPKGALEFMIKFAQFNVPTLNKTDLTSSDKSTTIKVSIKK